MTALTRRSLDGRDCRYCLGALLSLAVAAGAVAYGLSNQDVVTALGGLLFLPPTVVFAGLGLRGPNVRDRD